MKQSDPKDVKKFSSCRYLKCKEELNKNTCVNYRDRRQMM